MSYFPHPQKLSLASYNNVFSAGSTALPHSMAGPVAPDQMGGELNNPAVFLTENHWNEINSDNNCTHVSIAYLLNTVSKELERLTGIPEPQPTRAGAQRNWVEWDKIKTMVMLGAEKIGGGMLKDEYVRHMAVLPT
jgi:hypothetical protein